MNMSKIAGALVAGCLGGAITLGAFKMMEEPAPSINTTTEPTASIDANANIQQVSMPNYAPSTTGAVPEGAVSFTVAAEQSVNSVVHITSESTVEQTSYDPFLDFFGGGGGRSYRQPRMASGSGVIVSEDGYIVTNNHVIEDAEKLTIVLNDNRSYEATVIGTDPSTDLALIKIDEKNLPFVKYGNSDDVRVGEWVLAVGNPFNLNSTVTAGIVSAKGRNINLLQYNADKEVFPLESFIQTDAAVNPGNSGGALVNTNGELIGINTAIASRTGSYAGYSFAVPVNIVQKITNDLLEFGKVQRAFIGVSIRDMNAELAEELDIDEIRGVYVNDLTEDGAASEAGIEKGDVITKVGSVDVKNVPELQEQVARFRPGDKINVTLKRGGKSKVVTVTLRNMNGDTEIITHASETAALETHGASLTMADESELRGLNLDYGVKVEELDGGKLRSAGIKQGFIITKIDKVKMKTPSQVEQALSNASEGVLIEGVYPNGMRAYYGFGM